MSRAEAAINRWDHIRDNDQSLERFFAGLSRALTWTSWLLWLVLAGHLLALPEVVLRWMWIAVRVQVIVAAGVSLVRSTGAIVDTLDGLSHSVASRRDWLRYYDHLRPLVPTFRASLEYVVWIGIAALVLVQVDGLRGLSAWGPRFIEAIGIFFVGRVVIELGHLEIGHRLLPRAGLSDAERRRRGTMVPLVRSIFTYATYFAVVVLVLATIGFNPMPFLAGAGILGLVVGFGSQSLISDVVSGFFILFENVYLVGDTIETGSARGVVEAIEFRTTKVRDDEAACTSSATQTWAVSSTIPASTRWRWSPSRSPTTPTWPRSSTRCGRLAWWYVASARTTRWPTWRSAASPASERRV